MKLAFDKEEFITEYKIDVYLTPDHANYKTPYFWCVQQWNNEWCNAGSGWSRAPETAFIDALQYYNRHYGSVK